MRKAFPAALFAILVCVAGTTRDAAATVTFCLVWTSTSGPDFGLGTSAILAFPGDTIEVSLILTTDQTLGRHGVSIGFDTDLDDELNLLGAGNWAGLTFGTTTAATTYAQIAPNSPISTIESTGVNGGRINTYESGQISGPLFLPTGSYVIGTARFVVNKDPGVDGLDLFSGLFNVGVDTVQDNIFAEIPSSGLVFNGASVNLLPEPGTASLLGLGLVGLVLATRRSRRV